MKRREVMPLNTAVFLTETTGCDSDEVGALAALLMWLWVNDRPIQLAQMPAVCRVSSERFGVIWCWISRHFVETPGGWLVGDRERWHRPERPTWSTTFYAAAIQRGGLLCRYCGDPVSADLTIDHVIPRCQGGGDDLNNLVVACRSCNSRKGGRTPEQAGMSLRLVP